MKYRTSNIEIKTASNGNPYKSATFTGQDGSVTEKITTFGDSPIYDMVIEGGVVEGTINTNAKGYKNFSAFNASPQKATGFKGGGGAAAMAKKQEGIKQSMDRKEEGIKISSTFREAIAITLAQLDGKDFTEAEFQKQAVWWRQWLNKFYDDKLTSNGTEVPFEDDGLDQIITDVAF